MSIDLAAIEEREKAATKGPWWVTFTKRRPKDGYTKDILCGMGLSILHRSFEDPEQPDCDFIAHARTDIPDLIAELKRYRERAKVVRLQLTDDELSALIEACNVANRDVSDPRPPWDRAGLAARRKLLTEEGRRDRAAELLKEVEDAQEG